MTHRATRQASIRRKATGRTPAQLDDAIAEARNRQHHVSKTDFDFEAVRRADVDLAEWTRIADVVATTGMATYDPDRDPIVQQEAVDAAELQDAIVAEQDRHDAIRAQAEEHRLRIETIALSLTDEELSSADDALRGFPRSGSLTRRQAALMIRLAHDPIPLPDTTATDVATLAAAMTVRQLSMRREAARIAHINTRDDRRLTPHERETLATAWIEWTRAHERAQGTA